MADNKPFVLGGRTLDPAFQMLMEGAAAAAGAAEPAAPTPESARAQVAAMPLMFAGAAEEGVAFEDIAIAAKGRTIPARLYKPANQDVSSPLLVFYHFGGGVIGSIETCHVFCSILAKESLGPVLNVEYRLAPEHRFPAGLDDAMDSYEWAVANAANFGAPANKAGVGGDSMGGNFAAIVAQEMKRRNGPAPIVQLLIYPALDVASTLPSFTIFKDAFPLNAATMLWFMDNYMKPGDDPNDPRLSPLRAHDLKGLAPALIYTAGFDPLADEGQVYGEKLKAAGVPVRFVCFDALAHAFTAFGGASPAANAANRQIARETAAALKGKMP